MSGAENKFTPPYGIPFETFQSALKKMEKDGLPNRLDRSYLSSLNGNAQTYTIAACRGFELIDKDGVPTQLLKSLVQAGDDRRPVFEAIVQKHFTPILELGQTNATQAQLEELWTKLYGQAGETRRKAVRFFLALVAASGLQLSKLWKAPKVSTSNGGAKSTSRRERDRKPNSGTGAAASAAAAKLPGDSYTISLNCGGTVTLTVGVNLFDLARHPKDKAFVDELVSRLATYEAVPSPKSPDNEEVDAP